VADEEYDKEGSSVPRRWWVGAGQRKKERKKELAAGDREGLGCRGEKDKGQEVGLLS
jgi:hypothetical protein